MPVTGFTIYSTRPGFEKNRQTKAAVSETSFVKVMGDGDKNYSSAVQGSEDGAASWLR